ncbi:MAG TPA: helix-turn-helix transcriptional regulator [Thermoanaerobaculia bacterium]|nr:helix-turn-helix transcriptional regulator [Thermoanaerobaculia bacterium]
MDSAFLAAARLWDELGAYQSGDAEASRFHVMAGLCDLLGAHNAGWVGAVRTVVQDDDPLHGWRIGALSYLHPAEANQETIREMETRWRRREADPFNIIGVSRAGTFRVFTLRREMPESWFEADYYRDFYARRGIFDARCVSTPVTSDAESFFIFHRDQAAGAFGVAEIDLAAYTLRGRRRRHRSWMLARGLLIASQPLSPAERRVLGHLLSGDQEKQIAAKLELSATTTHDHVKSIYRKFGVGSRAALMSLWLDRPAASSRPDH